mgnify:FL=1
MKGRKPQDRAGKEVAEDAKRAVRRAFEHVGLELYQVQMSLAPAQKARFILGGANPQDWPHEIPALSVEFWGTTTGRVTPIRVFCDASNDNPAMSIASGVLAVKDCVCGLEQLPNALKDVWAERQELLARQTAGEQIHSFIGKFRWEWATMGSIWGDEK